ncbi:MAG: nucleoside deaminase [Chloroflexota bacterium]
MSAGEHERFMRIALEEAQTAKEEGNSPVGSVIVRDGDVIARGRNLVYTEHDITAHAETVALRNGGKAAQTVDFTGCTLYTTFEPCPMCCAAIQMSGVSTVIMGGRLKVGESNWPGYKIEDCLKTIVGGGRIAVVTGILQEECEAIRL